MHAISRTLLAASCGILVTAGAVRPAHAQRLTTRADLLSVLGGTARTETFDDVTTTADVYALSATPSLDASTVFPGVGAGRIEAGVAFSNRNNGHQFFGWQHDGGISRVHFAGGTNDAASVRIDDLTFGPGATTVTPEPATLALAAVGLVALGGAARRRVRRS
jgi:hypothetical protein